MHEHWPKCTAQLLLCLDHTQPRTHVLKLLTCLDASACFQLCKFVLYRRQSCGGGALCLDSVTPVCPACNANTSSMLSNILHSGPSRRLYYLPLRPRGRRDSALGRLGSAPKEHAMPVLLCALYSAMMVGHQDPADRNCACPRHSGG
jgi:hypothetical protein